MVTMASPHHRIVEWSQCVGIACGLVAVIPNDSPHRMSLVALISTNFSTLLPLALGRGHLRPRWTFLVAAYP